MSEYLEVKAKTIDEAIMKGLAQMDVSIDEVNIDIIEEGGKGFLGLGRSAVVRLTRKGEEGTAAASSEKPAVKPAAKKERPEFARKKREDQKKPAKKSETAAKTDDDEKTQAAIEFLNGMFQKMRVDATAQGKRTQDGIFLEITGDSTGVLIGPRGDTLDAIQYLTSLVVNKGKAEYIRGVIDTENYRKKREDTLVKLANRMAAKVEKSGRRMVLEPMNPYERRILHSTIQNHPGVESLSEGEDPYRRVVIRKKR